MATIKIVALIFSLNIRYFDISFRKLQCLSNQYFNIYMTYNTSIIKNCFSRKI